jgi:hypothetical protein
MTMAKLSMMIKCTLSAIRFNGNGGSLMQYKAHHPMQHVPGYSRSHWMPPLGNYLLHIAPAAARATANKTTTKNVPKRLAILMAVAMHRYNTAQIAH